MPEHATGRMRREKNETQVKVTGDLDEYTRRVVDAITRRAYEIFEARGYKGGRNLDDWLQAEAELHYPIQLDVEKLDNTLVVKGELSGFGTDEIEVKVEPRTLPIVGERKQPRSPEGKETTQPSQRARLVHCTLELPEPVLAEKATASLREGILEVILPKAVRKSGPISNAA